MKYGESSRPKDYVPDDVCICVVGDLTSMVHVGDVVEVSLHVLEGGTYNPHGSGFWRVESIREFKICVGTKDFRKIA